METVERYDDEPIDLDADGAVEDINARFNTKTSVPFKRVETPLNPRDYRNVSVHQFLHDCYYATGGFLGVEYSYLVADGTENYYNTRNQMSIFINDMQRYITAQYSRVYTDCPPQYDTTDPILLKMIKNVDRRGSSIDDMKKFGLANCLLDGTVFIASGHDGAEGAPPYIVLYTAKEFDSQLSTFDDFGNVTTYVFNLGDHKYHVYSADKFLSLVDNSKKRVVKEMTTAAETDMPEQVVRPIYSIPSYGRTVLPVPNATLSIARMSLNLYELRSRMVQLMTRQLFDRLVITGDVDSVPDGMTNALALSSETASAQLLSPDSSITKTWLEVIDNYTAIMHEHMRDGGVIIQSTSQIPESGASKKHTYQPIEAVLLKSVGISEEFDAYCVDARNLWIKDSAAAEMEVEYCREYTPDSGLGSNEMREAWTIAKESNIKELQDEVLSSVLQAIGVPQGSAKYAEIMKKAEITEWKSEFRVNE